MPTLTRTRVAVLLLGVYLLTFSGHFHGIDELAAHATIESLVREGTLRVEQFRWALDWTPTQVALGSDGALYSKRGLAHSLAFLPLWALGHIVDGAGLVQMSAFTNVLTTTAAAILLMRTAVLLGASTRPAATIGLLYGLTTPAWPYARFHYSEPLTTLCWLAAFWITVRGYRQSVPWRSALFGGLVLGAGLLVHKVNAIALLVLGGWWLWQSYRRGRLWRAPAAFVVGALPSLVLLAGVNWLQHGTVLTTGYTSPEERFVFDYVNSIPGLLVSPGKGIVWFAPVAVVALAGWRGCWRERRTVAVLVIAWIAGALAVYGSWFMWWGGWSWGPRYLVPVLPLLLLPLVWYPHGRSATLALLGAGIVGFLVNAQGALVDFNLPLVELARRGISDADAIWMWSAWPPLSHVRLLLRGRIDVAWLSSTPDLPVVVALAGLTAIALLLRRRAYVYLCAGLLLLAAVIGVQRHPWHPTDAALRDVDAAIEAEATPNDHVLVELVPYYDYFTTIQAWMNRYEAAPPYRTVVRGEDLPDGIRPEAAGRLWLVLERTPQGDPAGETESALLHELALFDDRWIGDFRVVRLVSLPETDTPQHAVFTNGIELDVEMEPRGDLVVVGLAWQPTEAVERNLKVFVQLVGPDGVVVQHDRVPHNGLTPTTSWAPGAAVREGYALPYTSGGDVVVGLYDATTGERVTLVGGGDFIHVGTVPAP